MTTVTVEGQLELIRTQLGEIQADLAVRNRRLAELEELKDDLAVVMKDVAAAAILELDEVAPFLQSGDLMALFKKLLRSTNHISQLLEKLEGAADFVSDAEPIGHDLFHRFIFKLAELERKGYFATAADLQSVLDALVKVVAEKGVLPAVQRSLVTIAATDDDKLVKYSLWKMYRATRSPDMQRLLGLCLTFVTTLASELGADKLPRNG